MRTPGCCYPPVGMNPRKKRYCLEKASSLQPDDPQIRQALSDLAAQSGEAGCLCAHRQGNPSRSRSSRQQKQLRDTPAEEILPVETPPARPPAAPCRAKTEIQTSAGSA